MKLYSDASSAARRTILFATVAVATMGFAGAAQATLTISKKATQNVTCTSGVCTATDKKAVLNVTDLTNLLAGGDVKIVSGKKGASIDVQDSFEWAGSTKLTLDSYTGITIEKPVSVTGTGGLTIIGNDGGSDGTFLFTGKGSVLFWDLSSSLIIQGQSFTLVNSLPGLASAVAANSNGNYALAASYNAKADGTYKSSPIPADYGGWFEGLGNTISNLKIKVKSNNAKGHAPAGTTVALFNSVSANGRVENIALPGASVSAGDSSVAAILVGSLAGTVFNASSGGSVSVGNGVVGQQESPVAGGLVGSVAGSGIVARSTSSASITGGIFAFAGGLIGAIYDGGEVDNSSASGSVVTGDSGSSSGGLIGLVYNASGDTLVSGCSASGNASAGATSVAGGLIGTFEGSGLITLSYATGSATVTAGSGSVYSVAGGLVGYVPILNNTVSTISQSYATGAVVGAPTTLIGGLVGDTQGTVADSYATGAVSASGSGFTALGGLAGYITATGSISTSYSTGTVQSVAGSWVGGFIGGDTGTLASDDWDTTTSGITNLAQGAGNTANAAGVSGLTDTQLKSGLPAGFNPAVWGQNKSINGGLPYLLALPPG